MLFPPRWTSSYEENPAGDPQLHSLDLERTPFFHCCADAGVAGDFSRCAQTRLAAAHVLPADRFSVRGPRGSDSFREFRPQPDVFFHEQPRQPFRAIHAVLRDSAICTGMGAGIALQDSGVRLADEAIRKRSGSGRAATIGFETYVAAYAGCC